MKKVLYIAIFVFFVAINGQAATITSDGTSIGDAEFKTSTGVTITAFSGPSSYAAKSHHKNGSKYYCTSDDEQIVSNDSDYGLSDENSTCE